MPKRPTISLDRRTYEKNLDNMKLLVTYEPFHDEILRIRERMEIPPCGLPLKNEVLAAWSDKMTKRMDEMFESPNTKQMIAAIGAKLRRGDITREAANAEMKKVYRSFPWNYLSAEIKFLITKYRIPHNYDSYIRDYIITDRINAPYQNFSIIFYTDVPTSVSRKRKVGIEIYTRPTSEELRDIKRTLDMWARELPSGQTAHSLSRLPPGSGAPGGPCWVRIGPPFSPRRTILQYRTPSSSKTETAHKMSRFCFAGLFELELVIGVQAPYWEYPFFCLNFLMISITARMTPTPINPYPIGRLSPNNIPAIIKTNAKPVNSESGLYIFFLVKTRTTMIPASAIIDIKM